MQAVSRNIAFCVRVLRRTAYPAEGLAEARQERTEIGGLSMEGLSAIGNERTIDARDV